MSEICRLTIPVNFSRTNPNTRQHWRYLHDAKKALKVDAEKVWLVAGKPRSATPVTVNVLARCWKQMDSDNLLSSLKAAFDGLFKGAITPDDSPEWVTIGAIEQENAKEYRLKPEVVITVLRTAA